MNIGLPMTEFGKKRHHDTSGWQNSAQLFSEWRPNVAYHETIEFLRAKDTG